MGNPVGTNRLDKRSFTILELLFSGAPLAGKTDKYGYRQKETGCEVEAGKTIQPESASQ
jgi:hypothetical protein